MSRPFSSSSPHRDKQPQLAVANPLIARDPVLFSTCAEHRERCLDLLLAAMAATDMHEPDQMGPPPHYTLNQVKSCVQVFDVLCKPVWTQHDLDRFEAYSPWAWKGELFGDLAEEARHRIRSAVEDAQEQMTRASGAHVAVRRASASDAFRITKKRRI